MNRGRRIMYVGAVVALLISVTWLALGQPGVAVGFSLGFCVGMVVVALAVLADPRWTRR